MTRIANAPILNGDVLFEILADASPQVHAAAALTCKFWYDTAVKLLYRSITVKTWVQQPSKQSLARTMSDCPHLRAFVRQICLYTGHGTTLEDLEWLELFPEHSLRNFTYVAWPRSSFPPAILDFPAIRTVPYLTAHGPDSDADLQACLSLPRLETLELNLINEGISPVLTFGGPTNGALSSHLTDIRLSVAILPNAGVLTVLAAFAQQLSAFHVHVSPKDGREIQHRHKGWDEWTREFVKHGRRVRKLVFSGFPSVFPARLNPVTGLTQAGGPDTNRAYLPLDAVATGDSVVEHLCCLNGLYSPRLFKTLGSRVSVLEFYVDGPQFPFEEALMDLLARRIRDGLALRTVRIYHGSEDGCCGEFEGIKGACGDSGVVFDVVEVDKPLHNPPTWPPIVWD